MRSITILLLSFHVCVNLNAQKSKTINSFWHENTGEDPEYSLSDFSHHSKGKFDYFIANNNEYIYLLIKTNTAIQNRILTHGMTIWINMDNKPIRNLGIRFPLGYANSDTGKAPGLPEENSKTTNQDSLYSFANTIELIGFRGEERRFPSDNTGNFGGHVKSADGKLHYLMRMPTAKLPLRNAKTGVGAMPFTIGIEPGGSGPVFWINNVKLAPGI
jgi:hypothetical protein